jgi:hypothetical protein
LFKLYDNAKVEGAFIFEFCPQNNTYHDNPNFDFDIAGFGITKSVEENNWETQDSFYRIAEYYRS